MLSKAAGARGRAAALEGVECQRYEPPPGVWGVGAGDVHDGGVGDQEKQQVLAGEVLAQLADGLGALDELHHPVVGQAANPLDVFPGGERHGQQVGKAAVTGLKFADPFHESAKAGPRVRDCQGLLGGLGILADLLDERGGNELLAGGEPAVHGGDADPGARGQQPPGSGHTSLRLCASTRNGAGRPAASGLLTWRRALRAWSSLCGAGRRGQWACGR